MDSQNGGASPPLAQILFDAAHRFDFFQAVRLLERLYRDRLPVGGATADPAREVVRFRSNPLLRFPPKEIVDLSGAPEDDSLQPQMIVNFMGLTGPAGVLPYHYTEQVVLDRANNDALWDFLDIFTHRMVSLLYRAWEKGHSQIAYERDRNDPFTAVLFALAGLGMKELRDGSKLPAAGEGVLRYCGVVARHPRAAADVESVLGDCFGVTTRVKQCVGQWLPLEDESFFRLSSTQPHGLGISTILGTQIWDDQSKFRLQLGPLDFAEFVAFLPTGAAFEKTVELTRFLAGPEFDFDLELILRAGDVPCFELRSEPESARGLRLGWTTWLKTVEREEDAHAVPSLDWREVMPQPDEDEDPRADRGRVSEAAGRRVPVTGGVKI